MFCFQKIGPSGIKSKQMRHIKSVCSKNLKFGKKEEEKEQVAPRCSIKIGVLKILPTFAGRYLCRSLIFYKGSGQKQETPAQVFHMNFAKLLRALVLAEHFRWQLLEKMSICEKFTH